MPNHLSLSVSLDELEKCTVGQFAEWLDHVQDRATLLSTNTGWKDLTSAVFKDEQLDNVTFETFEEKVFRSQIQKIRVYLEKLPKSGDLTPFSEELSLRKRYGCWKQRLLDAYRRLPDEKQRAPEGLKSVHSWAINELESSRGF